MEVIFLSHEVEVDGPAERVQAFAARLGKDSNQASVLVFHESESGRAARYVFNGIGDRAEATRLLGKFGPNGGSLSETALTVIAVDEADEAAVERLTKAVQIKPRRTVGDVVLVGREGK